MFRSSVWRMLHVSLLMPGILSSVLDFWKIWESLVWGSISGLSNRRFKMAYLATRGCFFYGFLIIWAVSRRNGCAGVIPPPSVQFFELQYVSDIWQSPISEYSPSATAVSVYYISPFDIFCIEVFSRRLPSCLSQVFWKFYCSIIDSSEPELTATQLAINSPSFV